MSIITDAECTSLINELESAIASGNVRRRLVMLTRASDLFMAGSRYYSDEQLALFDDVLARLTAEVEVKARARVSRLVAQSERGIPKLIRSLAFDDAIEVAAPVLSRSPQLSDADLVENASTKGQDHLLAIARRIRLSEMVTDVLVSRGDQRVRRSVAKNAGARLSLAGYEKLTTHARKDRDLAHVMLCRSDVPRQCFLRLIENAAASVRAKFEASMPVDSATIAVAVNDVARAMTEEARDASRSHLNAVRDRRWRLRAESTTMVNVHAPAVAHRFDKVVVALARLGRFEYYLVERALLDHGADMVLILAKAAGCPWVTTKALLRMYPSKRTLSRHDIAQASAKYERLSQKAARLAIAFHERRAAPQTAAADSIKTDANPSIADDEPCDQPKYSSEKYSSESVREQGKPVLHPKMRQRRSAGALSVSG
jgi:uncharacterized protein (DUF2336 family)